MTIIFTILCYAGYPLANILGVYKGGAMESLGKTAICGGVTIFVVIAPAIVLLCLWLSNHLHWV
jgi:hypothetical protein